MSYRNPKFDREFAFSRRLLTVETGARASDIKRLAWSFDQALSFWRLLSRYERDSRSTLNGNGAKKTDYRAIDNGTTSYANSRSVWHGVQPGSSKNIFILCKINPAVTDVPAATRATSMLNARNVLIFVVFACPGAPRKLTRFTPPLRFVILEMNLQPRQERSLNIWGEMHENSSHSCFLCRADVKLRRTFWRLIAKFNEDNKAWGILIYLYSD